MEIVTAINAILGLLEVLIPQMTRLFSNGQITIEQQQEVFARITALKKGVDEGFTGPEWEPSDKDNA